MLPEHVNIILLSATVPNTKEFADWVGYVLPSLPLSSSVLSILFFSVASFVLITHLSSSITWRSNY